MVATVVIVVPMVAMMAAVVAVLRGRCLPSHYGGLVIRHRLHHTVLWLRLVMHDGRLVVRRRLLVVGHRSVTVGRITVRMVLAGNAGTDQAAGTGTHDGTIAAPYLVANGGTGHGTDTGAQNGVEIIRVGCGSQAGQAAS